MSRLNARLTALAVIGLLVFLISPPVAAQRQAEAFRAFIESLWPDAQARGISRGTFEAATRGIEPDLGLPNLVIPGRVEPAAKGQAEFTRTPADYMSEATLTRLSNQGKKLAAEHKATLARIEREYGVPSGIILAIWGRETAFGGYKLPHNALRVLATQAWLGRRKEMFREEFLLALKMIEEGHARAAEMRSSWAGAMGLTQFLPSDFYKHAVDFDGDGRLNIFTSVPDSLAGAAKQLVDKGWRRERRWGFEVRTPKSVDCTIAVPDVAMPVSEWISQGFAPAAGTPNAAELLEEASLFLPAGPYGPAFLTLKNFYVLKAYNFADLYALFVGHLADRISADARFVRRWDQVVQLSSEDLEAMQRQLAERGLYRDRIDGKAGMKTRVALGTYQKTNGLAVDCWPSAEVLDHMRRSARN